MSLGINSTIFLNISRLLLTVAFRRFLGLGTKYLNNTQNNFVSQTLQFCRNFHTSILLCRLLFLSKTWIKILCSWFRTSLISINNRETRCNTKQSIYYSASSFYMFRVSTTPIIRSTQNCNHSLRYWSYFLCGYLPPWPRWREVAAQYGRL